MVRLPPLSVSLHNDLTHDVTLFRVDTILMKGRYPPYTVCFSLNSDLEAHTDLTFCHPLGKEHWLLAQGDKRGYATTFREGCQQEVGALAHSYPLGSGICSTDQVPKHIVKLRCSYRLA